PPGTEDAATLSEAALRDIVRREVSAAVPEALRSGPSPGGLPIAGETYFSLQYLYRILPKGDMIIFRAMAQCQAGLSMVAWNCEH
ncbi:hypothetical protein GBAR_LOCUS13924, partial [Geodia barretti]